MKYLMSQEQKWDTKALYEGITNMEEYLTLDTHVVYKLLQELPLDVMVKVLLYNKEDILVFFIYENLSILEELHKQLSRDMDFRRAMLANMDLIYKQCTITMDENWNMFWTICSHLHDDASGVILEKLPKMATYFVTRFKYMPAQNLYISNEFPIGEFLDLLSDAHYKQAMENPIIVEAFELEKKIQSKRPVE